jgi:hypothetical protein
MAVAAGTIFGQDLSAKGVTHHEIAPIFPPTLLIQVIRRARHLRVIFLSLQHADGVSNQFHSRMSSTRGHSFFLL